MEKLYIRSVVNFEVQKSLPLAFCRGERKAGRERKSSRFVSTTGYDCRIEHSHVEIPLLIKNLNLKSILFKF